MLNNIVSDSVQAADDREKLIGAIEASLNLLTLYQSGEAKTCNCAECGIELLGRCHMIHRALATDEDKAQLPQVVAGRIKNRPYCAKCLGYSF